jgi:hypothetical protein
MAEDQTGAEEIAGGITGARLETKFQNLSLG